MRGIAAFASVGILLVSLGGCGSAATSASTSTAVSSATEDEVDLTQYGMPTDFVVNYDDDMSIREYLMWETAALEIGDARILGTDLSGLHLAPTDEVEFVRFVNYTLDASMVRDCLATEGYPVQPPPVADGTSFMLVPADYAGQVGWIEARWACAGQYPEDPLAVRPMTENQARKVYDYYVQTVMVCLDQAGFHQTTPIPTFETWFDSAGTPTGAWTPWSGAVDVDPLTDRSNYEQVFEACPFEMDLAEIYE